MKNLDIQDAEILIRDIPQEDVSEITKQTIEIAADWIHTHESEILESIKARKELDRIRNHARVQAQRDIKTLILKNLPEEDCCKNPEDRFYREALQEALNAILIPGAGY